MKRERHLIYDKRCVHMETVKNKTKIHAHQAANEEGVIVHGLREGFTDG